MLNGLAWGVFALGAAHVIFGVVRYRAALADALGAGFFGKFGTPEIRRTAYWFVAIGPLLMLVGQLAIHAAASGDLTVFRIIGTYMLVFAIVGVSAFPASPIWLVLALSVPLILTGYGWWN